LKKFFIIFILIISAALYAQEKTRVGFHNFAWGTSMQEFISKMGKPAHIDNINGLQSLVYDNLIVSGYAAFMVAYFSKDGLEGGTYYFNTLSYDELVNCYKNMQKELLSLYGPTSLIDMIFKELAPYESLWKLNTGYVHLKVDTRRNEPVTLWYSSPTLTKILFGS